MLSRLSVGSHCPGNSTHSASLLYQDPVILINSTIVIKIIADNITSAMAEWPKCAELVSL
mgnify:CR=1 FL=1